MSSNFLHLAEMFAVFLDEKRSPRTFVCTACYIRVGFYESSAYSYFTLAISRHQFSIVIKLASGVAHGDEDACYVVASRSFINAISFPDSRDNCLQLVTWPFISIHPFFFFSFFFDDLFSLKHDHSLYNSLYVSE